MTDYIKPQQMVDIAALLVMMENADQELNKMTPVSKNERAVIVRPVAVHSQDDELLGYLVRESDNTWSFTQDPL